MARAVERVLGVLRILRLVFVDVRTLMVLLFLAPAAASKRT